MTVAATSVTRASYLGPLTTPFTQPTSCSGIFTPISCPTCSYGWLAQTCTLSNDFYYVQDDINCWPSLIAGATLHSPPPFSGGGFYSPGLQCPNGYLPACSSTDGVNGGFSFQFGLAAGETAMGCCPTYVRKQDCFTWRDLTQTTNVMLQWLYLCIWRIFVRISPDLCVRGFIDYYISCCKLRPQLDRTYASYHCHHDHQFFELNNYHDINVCR